MDDIRKTNRYSKEEKQAFIQEFKTAGSEQSLAYGEFMSRPRLFRRNSIAYRP